MKKQLSFVFSLSVLVFFAACGDETTKVIETTGMSVVKKGSKIPDCTADNVGEMIYATDSAAAYYCADGKWESLQGEPGKQGDPGDSGKSCTAKKLTSGNGYKIECGGDSVGVVLDGVDGKSFVDGWMVDPRDKQLYKTVTIGNQIWMAENLNYAYTEPTKDNGLDSSSFCFNNEPDNCAKYGRLYLWSAVMDSAGVLPGNTANGCGKGSDCLVSGIVRGVCPMGWHLPDSTEWETLFTSVGGKDKAGTVLKSVSGWTDDGDGTDDYSFNAIPSGYRNGGGNFAGVGGYAYFWGAPLANNDAYGVHLDYDLKNAVLDYLYRNYGRSVRCLKDSE